MSNMDLSTTKTVTYTLTLSKELAQKMFTALSQKEFVLYVQMGLIDVRRNVNYSFSSKLSGIMPESTDKISYEDDKNHRSALVMVHISPDHQEEFHKFMNCNCEFKSMFPHTRFTYQKDYRTLETITVRE